MAPRTVAGRYELADPLGSGGGGVVWRAHDVSLGRTVAVKEIELSRDLSAADRERQRARAMREARAAARLQHRHVVNVYDVHSTDDAIFIVMEHVDAPSLQHLVATEGPLPPPQVAQIGLDVLDALEAAHAAGIVHRDIKPSNVLVGGPDGAQVTDFGIAAVTDDASLTMTGQALGTPDYVSPEQVSDAAVGPPTDVWSLGATLYHAVEGHAPFRRDRSLSTVHAVVHALPHPMVRAGPLAGPLTRMLAKDPAQRPSVAEARSQVAAVVEGRAAHEATAAMAPMADETVRIAPVPSAPTPPTEPSSPPSPDPAPPPGRASPQRLRHERDAPPRTGRWAAAVVGLLLLAVTAALLLTNELGTEPDEAPVGPTDTATDQQPPPATSSPSPQDTTAPEATEAPEEPSPEPTPTASEPEPEPTDPPSPEPTATDPVTVPAGWQVHEGPSYTVAHPEGWTTRDAPATAIDLVSPDSPAYLRVAHTDSPADDVLADSQRIAEAFEGNHPDYELLRLEPTPYRDTEAVIWEYVFSADGQPYRGAHLNLSTGENGYALNYVAPPSIWQQDPGRWEQFTGSFAPQ